VKKNEKHFYLFFFTLNILLSQMSVLYRDEYYQAWVGKGRLHALFTLVVTWVLAYPNKWGLEEKRCRICFHYLYPSGTPKYPSSVEKEGF